MSYNGYKCEPNNAMALDKSLSVRVIGREMLTSEHLETIWASTTGLTSGFVSDLGGGCGGVSFEGGSMQYFCGLGSHAQTC